MYTFITMNAFVFGVYNFIEYGSNWILNIKKNSVQKRQFYFVDIL